MCNSGLLFYLPIPADIRPLFTGVNISEGLAVDWINHNLFWTDTGKHTIEVASLHGRYRKVLYTEEVDLPRAIVVHPTEG